jgi:phenylalanyl-tRNA synthetase beta chain
MMFVLSMEEICDSLTNSNMKILPEALKYYIGDRMPPTSEIEKLFTFHAFEIEDIERVGEYKVIDVKVLPDRSSDCLSHRGVAHELAALVGAKLVKDPLREPIPLEPKTEKLSVVIHDVENCRRFTGALITNVKIGPSPEWLRNLLEALGQRSINNVVDATNYVMLMLGQPLHAYDADKFPHDASGWHFGVRMAREGEKVVTLSNETLICTPKVQLIVDAQGDIPVGIAGVKGGKYAEIDVETKNIILEGANFDPVITRRSSQSLRLQTDASKRFENELPPELAAYGVTECVRLIQEIAGGVCEGYVDEYPTKRDNVTVSVPHAQLTALLGLEIPPKDVEAILSRLSFQYETTADGWNVTAPFERTDVCIAEDVIADVGRVYGYEHVESEVPKAVPLAELNIRHYYSELIRDTLVAEGFSEVITSSFRKKDEIELANALASDKGCLRSTLRENIREALDRNMPNADLLKLRALKIFEIGTVFEKAREGKGVTEYTEVAIGARQKQGGYNPKDDVYLSEIVAKLEEVLGASLNGTTDKGIYSANLTELLPKLSVPTAYAPFRGASEFTYAPFSQYPFVSRDIALWAEEGTEGTTESDIRAIINDASGELLLHTTLFDVFHKEGKVSYAFRLVFQSFERTLTDEEVGKIMESITTTLTNRGYIVR